MHTNIYTLKGDDAISVVVTKLHGGGVTIKDADLGISVTVLIEDVPELVDILNKAVKEVV